MANPTDDEYRELINSLHGSAVHELRVRMGYEAIREMGVSRARVYNYALALKDKYCTSQQAREIDYLWGEALNSGDTEGYRKLAAYLTKKLGRLSLDLVPSDNLTREQAQQALEILREYVEVDGAPHVNALIQDAP